MLKIIEKTLQIIGITILVGISLGLPLLGIVQCSKAESKCIEICKPMLLSHAENGTCYCRTDIVKVPMK